MTHYIIQTITFQLFFLLIYDAFLKKETFFNWNRAYLLITTLLSICLPFIKVEPFKTVVPQDFIIRLPEVVIGNVTTSETSPSITLSQVVEPTSFQWSWLYLLYAGMLFATVLLLYKSYKVHQLIQNNPKRWNGNLILVQVFQSSTAFSFFNYIFLGENIKTSERAIILNHEMVHVKHKHSADLVLFELLRIVFWFNPLIYMYQNRIASLHEFIADAEAVKQNDKTEYYQNLLSQAFDAQNVSFINPFFKKSLIKKRILMLSKSKSKQVYLLKYALLFPVVFGMLLYTSSYAQEVSKVEHIEENIAVQDLSDEALKKKFYDEIVQMEKNGATFMEIADYVMPKFDNYIKSREQYYKLEAYMDYIFEKNIERKSLNDELTQYDLDVVEGKRSERKTYTEYLEWKKTDEAIERWESNTRDGAIRLYLTKDKDKAEEENAKYAKALEIIENDDNFHTLYVFQGNSTVKMVIDEIDSKRLSTTPKDDVVIKDIEESIEVPFAVIENVPIPKSCESLTSKDERKTCMINFVTTHVNTNFNTNIAKENGLTGQMRINVIFKIDKEGNVVEVKSRAPHPALETEAKRVINSLPKFIPGTQKGKPVVVPYSLPILFMVDSDKQTETGKTLKEMNELASLHKNSVPFSTIDIVPTIEDCVPPTNTKSQKKCVSNYIETYVNKNFDKNIAKKLGLKGEIMADLFFLIDDLGIVREVSANSAHPELEAEARRVVHTLPVFVPGKHKGKVVVVAYSSRIYIKLNE